MIRKHANLYNMKVTGKKVSANSAAATVFPAELQEITDGIMEADLKI